MQKTTLTAAMLCCLAQSATANEFETAMRDFVDQNVAGWAASPILVQAI